MPTGSFTQKTAEQEAESNIRQLPFHCELPPDLIRALELLSGQI